MKLNEGNDTERVGFLYNIGNPPNPPARLSTNRAGEKSDGVGLVGFFRNREYLFSRPLLFYLTRALYRQVAHVIGDLKLNRLVTIADLKTCSGVIHVDRVLVNRREFERLVNSAFDVVPNLVRERCGRDGMPEFYGSVMWFLNRGERGYRKGSGKYTSWDDVKAGRALLVPIGFDLVIDLDIDENSWLEGDDGLAIIARFGKYIGDKLGAEPSVLIGNGVQLRVTLLPIHTQLYGQDPLGWPDVVMKHLPRAHMLIVKNLARHFPTQAGLSIEVRFDRQVYDPARITRLDLSPHAGIKAFSIPLRPSELMGLTWGEVRKMQADLSLIESMAGRYSGDWGRVIDAGKYLNTLQAFLSLMQVSIKIPQLTQVGTQTIQSNNKVKAASRGWRSVEVPGLGVVEYDARLEGFGWVEVLVKEKIPMQDGRMSMAWLVLPVAIAGPKTKSGKAEPLITRDEAIEWLRVCLERYPDPEGKTLDDYVKKLDYHMRYGGRYNIPTWKHLLEGKNENGSPLNPAFMHIREYVLKALTQAGLVRRVGGD